MFKRSTISVGIGAKGIWGLILAMFFFLLFTFGYDSGLTGVLCFFAFAGSGCLKIDFAEEKTAYAAYGVWTIFCVVFLILFPYYEIYNERIWSVIRDYTPMSTFVISAALVVVGICVFYVITANWRLSIILLSSLFSLLVIINGYVYRFRGKEFLFSDILSANTAFNVVEQYSLAMQKHTLCAVALGMLLLLAGFCLPKIKKKKTLRPRRSGLIIGCVLAAVFGISTKDMGVITWNSDGTLMYGYYTNFYVSLRDYFVDRPESYSYEEIENLEHEYEEKGGMDSSTLPNILIIMNESFADMRIFGNDLRTDQPITPFIDSLQENVISGYALTSVYGGGTANAEFECLSGFSMQFFPDNATPYQQYIHTNSFSLAWILDSLGYNCVATHPYLANGWSRPKVYPCYGFAESSFIEDYPQKNLIRYYVSDQEMYEYMLQRMNMAADGPIFLFGVTMQNHGGYGTLTENYTQTICLEGYQQEYPQAEEYLSLINQSDLAVEYLLTELEKKPEKTIVLFFGDHLPQIEPEFYEELHGGSFDTLDSQMLKYTVPFFIWANYDIPEQTVECTSLNYLGRYLLEATGMDLPPYYRFLKEAEEVIPAVNAMGYYSKKKQAFIPIEEATGEEAKWLEKYELLQYNEMFDKNNRSDVFFGNYIREEN